MNYLKLKSFGLSFISILIISLFLNSCGPLKFERADVKDSPINDADMRKRNIEEGRGFKLPGTINNKGGNFSFGNSNELWRATLDILEFTPLSNVDYGGGVIITDWYSTNNNLDQSIKISVQFLTDELRADGLLIKVYQKNCTTDSKCAVKLIESDLNQEIKLAILKKAAQIKKGDLKKKNEQRGEVIIPKNSKDRKKKK
jgi:hypothetical protein